MHTKTVSTGIPSLDEVLQGLRLGDNVVWQVDRLEDYRCFAERLAEQAIRERRKLVYLRFAPHEPVLAPRPGLTPIEVDPEPGFDFFSAEVHRIIEEWGVETYYVLDNLSALVEEWATDELLANFFQVTCPFLAELDTVAYFALTRGRHAHSAVARIRDTTQLLIDVYHVDGSLYIHPLKVWDRYSAQMFLPHLFTEEECVPVFHSGQAAALASIGRKHPLTRAADASIAPWDSVYRRLLEYRDRYAGELELPPEVAALKQEFTRMTIGDHEDFNLLADRHFTLDDLFNVRSRLIGSGRIGGKAAGMLLARAILSNGPGAEEIAPYLEPHDSFFIGSDVFFTFLVNNDLFRLRLQVSREGRLSPEEFEAVERRFLLGDFPPNILEQFRAMLDYFGQAPIIVRSSSLLEDSFGSAFAGKYRSEFCPNQGDPETRLQDFLRAVKLVYASALNPDALAYRRRRGMTENDEQMAILVQRVSGMPHREFFFPPLAGVAFSHNLYAWTDRIDPRQGIVRLVFGLGTRAVNRVGGDYPRLIAISDPELRPETGLKIAKYSQREVDVLDLRNNEFRTLPLPEVLGESQYPGLHLLVSEMQDGHVYDPVSRLLEGPPNRYVLTFNNLIRRTDFVPLLGKMLRRIQDAYGRPVDTEFTASVEPNRPVRINLLQCRPMWMPVVSERTELPADLPADRVLFRSNRVMSGGAVRRIRYILYIDPRAYAAIDSLDVKRSLGRIVGRVNKHPDVQDGRVVMMGPGRWGSSNIDLGVNVTYADIDNTAVLVEIAREEAGHVPEVSYGTHFFLDLVESQIIYLPVYPLDPGAQFNSAFFDTAPNSLADLLPDSASYADWIKVIDVPKAAGHRHAEVIANPETHSAVCYLA